MSKNQDQVEETAPVETTESAPEETVEETPAAKTEARDHADNGAAAETPVARPGLRDPNGALIING